MHTYVSYICIIFFKFISPHFFQNLICQLIARNVKFRFFASSIPMNTEIMYSSAAIIYAPANRNHINKAGGTTTNNMFII